MEKTNGVVAVYSTHPRAEEALRAFQSSGFDMKKLSIVGKDYHTEEHVISVYNAGDRMKVWGKRGAFWGGFWGILGRGASPRPEAGGRARDAKDIPHAEFDETQRNHP